MNIIDLSGVWQLKAASEISDDHAAARSWMTATVPGTVHTDLLSHGIIPDPFYRMNELDVQWVESVCWLYRREFTVDAPLLSERSVELIAEGLDTFAAIAINGKHVGSVDNMFIAHRFDVKKYLAAGTNSIEILFDSPVAAPKRLEKKFGALQVALEPHRVFARKAQYSYGWDWGPKLTTSGIWKSISIHAASGPAIRDLTVRTKKFTSASAELEIECHIERYRGPISLIGRIEGNEGREEFRLRATSPHVKTKLVIHRPKIWWPNGYGEQPLYTASIARDEPNGAADAVSVRFGIRTVTLLQEKDVEGRSFVICVNGVKIFCKGADWIPSDSFLPRITSATYERLLSMARDAHMTMVRVWGGGIYEQDIFYDLCDRFGLLVWQDFMFACGEYPQHASFLKNVANEAEQSVLRLRNHPSLAVWCGNNECEWNFCNENPGKTPDDMSGSVIFRSILPEIVKKADGTRPYWRSSPFGHGFPNAESNGTHHQWHVWSAWKDFKEYERDNARFIAEFGFQAPATIDTWKGVTVEGDRNPQHPVIEHHNKQVEGQERLFRFMAGHYPVASTFEDFIYRGQLVQANALKTGIEHWRRRKFRTSGAMFWQLNDCWPVSSWSVIDSGLRPKAAYYYAKRFFAPVLISITDENRSLKVWATNDSLKPVSGILRVCLLTFDGGIAFEAVKSIQIPANASNVPYKVSRADLPVYDPAATYIVATLSEAGLNTAVIAENRYFFVEPKHLMLPTPHLTARLNGSANGVSLELSSDVFVKDLFVSVEGMDVDMSDNYFDIDPGVLRSVRIVSRAGTTLAPVSVTLSSLCGPIPRSW